MALDLQKSFHQTVMCRPHNSCTPGRVSVSPTGRGIPDHNAVLCGYRQPHHACLAIVPLRCLALTSTSKGTISSPLSLLKEDQPRLSTNRGICSGNHNFPPEKKLSTQTPAVTEHHNDLRSGHYNSQHQTLSMLC